MSQFLRWLVDHLAIDPPLVPFDQFNIDGKLLYKIRKRSLQRLFDMKAVDLLWMHVEALKFGKLKTFENLHKELYSKYYTYIHSFD